MRKAKASFEVWGKLTGSIATKEKFEATRMGAGDPRVGAHEGHPSANAQGYVTTSNVDMVGEMVNMISASRSYQNNVEVMNTAKTLLLKTLQLGQ